LSETQTVIEPDARQQVSSFRDRPSEYMCAWGSRLKD